MTGPRWKRIVFKPSGEALAGPSGRGLDGPTLDQTAVEIIDIRQRLDHIIAKHTGQDYDKVRTDTERDYFMSSEEAVKYGIIDRVISEH